MVISNQKNASVGMRVMLTNPDKEYTIDHANPLVGTKWECRGTIDMLSKDRIMVRWDNGHTNSYKFGELSTSFDGVCKSIW
jgi:hypothetical protein